MWATHEKLFQNGFQLESGLFFEGVDSSASTKEIKNGATLTVQSGFILENLVEDVELEIGEAFSLSSTYQKMIIKMDDVEK
jgi:FKBP-type peptidyl-prolyl cis-trans isomerase (trigger factor)